MSAAAAEGRLRVQGVVEGDDVGPVFWARWRRSGTADRDVLVQVLDPDRLPADAVAARLADEVPRLARLEGHGGLVIERLLPVEGRQALLRRAVPAVDLATILADQELTPGLALAIGAGVARALAAAHGLPRGGALAHGALDVHKVQITLTGEVLVTGFGVAVARFAVEGVRITAADDVDPNAPPEGRAAGPTPAADIYALGCVVLAAMDRFLDGPPADAPAAHLARLDAVLHPLAARLQGELALLPDLLAVLLSFDPADRPTAADCAEALAALAEHDEGATLSAWASEVLPPLLAARDSAARALAAERGVFGLDLAIDPPPARPEPAASSLHSSLPEIRWDDDPTESTWDDVTMPTEPGDALAPGLAAPAAEAPAAEPSGPVEVVPPPPDGLPRTAPHPVTVPPPESTVPALTPRTPSTGARALPRMLLVILGVGVLAGGLLGVALVLFLGQQQAESPPAREISDVRLAPDIEDLVEGVEVDETLRTAPAPAAAPVTVGLEGDADAVFLVSDERRYKLPSPVPAGSWRIEAGFGGAPPAPQGTLLLQAGDALVIECAAAQARCRVR